MGSVGAQMNAQETARELVEEIRGLRMLPGAKPLAIEKIAAALDKARRLALEEAAMACEKESKRYMEHPVCLDQAVTARGCSLRIRELK